MLKLMVCDDEQIVLDSVRFMLSHHVDSFELVATAKSGREAILKAEQEVPDLILMDIKMPGINGLDAIREIRARLPNVRVIVISAYEQFEYARTAIELGVLDYVVKPLKKQVLLDLLAKTAEELDRERRRRQRDLENMEKLEKVLPVLEQGFIYSVLLHRELGGEIEKYRDLFDLSASHAYMLVLEFRDMRMDDSENAIGWGIRGQGLFPVVQDLIKHGRIALVGPLMVNRIVACVMESGTPNEYVQRLSAIRLAEELLGAFAEQDDLSCRIGIGGFRPVHEMAASCDEAMRCLRQAGSGAIVHIMDVHPDEPQGLDLNRFERLLLEKLETGAEDELDDVLSQVFQTVPIAVGQNRNKLMEWLVVAHRIAMENEVQEDGALNFGTYLTEMPDVRETHAFREWFTTRLLLLAGRIRAVRLGRTSRIIETAKRIMETEFASEISLESMSRRVNLSPRYFSKLFKDETGVNYIDCLTGIRIQHAKDMMQKSDKSIKEICYEVGYGDPNYFSRLFKKQTGFSPSEYARR